MATIDEKRKTAANEKAEIKDAKVIANYGDPGLDEDYHFDILSRYVIVMLESCDRILTADRWWKMLAVVKRPEHLWIKTEGGVSSSPATQQRSDALGNINVGAASSYSVNGIPRINTPYALGESIKVRRIPQPLTSDSDNIYQSAFTAWSASNFLYNSWHSEGSTLPYFAGNNNRIQSLLNKTINPIGTNGLFNFYLNKYQYEAFALTINLGNDIVSNNLTQIFTGVWNGGSQIYNANGGYLYNGLIFQLLAMVEYEDTNAGNKIRSGTNECIPLVVTTPDTFPTPKQRGIGTISYNPNYATVKTS